MRLLALMMVRNAEATLGRVLDGIAEFCDGIVVVEDRSDDNTQQVVREHPLVCQATFISGSNLPSRDWVIDEGILLNRLYRMAERETADWIVRFDVDETVAHGTTLRAVLERQGSDVSAVRFPKVSTWNDPKYPLMVALMGQARSMQGGAFRAGIGFAARQPHHNLRIPHGVEHVGRIADNTETVFLHSGWDTLDRRVAKARFYQAQDPGYAWNYGVPYDRGLLFGYALSETDDLIADYKERYRLHHAP